MKIAFNPSILNEYKGFQLPALKAEYKKIALIVSVIFLGLLFVGYMLKRFCFKAKPVINPELDVDICDAPKALIDRISPQIQAQFDKLRDSLSSAGTYSIENSQSIKLDDLNVSIEIILKRKINDFTGITTYCAATIFTNSAVVNITPKNDQVLKAVASYFKTQYLPKWGTKPPPEMVNLFNPVEINGKKLKM